MSRPTRARTEGRQTQLTVSSKQMQGDTREQPAGQPSLWVEVESVGTTNPPALHNQPNAGSGSSER